MRTHPRGLALLPLALLLAMPAASAFDAGDWSVRVGAHGVDPASDNGTLADGALEVDVDSDWKPSLMVEYFMTPAWGVELLAAWPFEHEVSLDGDEAASFKHLPPTLSLQYHFNSGGTVSPYLGAGVNYTWTYDEETTGPIAGSDLALDNSWGLAAHAGIDFKLGEAWYLGVDARWMDIDADASLDGTGIGTVNVDPWVYGIYAGWTF